MAVKVKKQRIVDTPTTATKMDFVGSNFILLDGDEGSKKVPMDLLADRMIYVEPEGTVEGDTMTVTLADYTYSKFAVPGTVAELVLVMEHIDSELNAPVVEAAFEFTLPEISALEKVTVQEPEGATCTAFSPMDWPGTCTYQGTVVNGIATIIGYTGETEDPLNPLGLPNRTIRVKFNTTDPVIDERWDASLVESSGGTSVWDITYNSDDWSNLFANRNDLVEVLGANTSNITNMSGIFSICSNLTNVAVFDTSRVENMYSAFQGTKITSFDGFDVSNVTNMSCMFRGCSTLESFNEKNTSSLRVTDSMFVGCSSLVEVLMDTSKVSSMECMFQYCTSLTDGPDIDTSACSNMKQMFEGCSNLESIPEYDTHNATNMSYMFNMCSNLRTVPDLETEHATDMYMMFNGCSALTEAPDMDTSNVVDMRYMFQGCGALKSVPAYDTTSLMECTAMFRGTGIETTPEMDFQNIKDLSGLFQGCTSLKTISDMTFKKTVNVNYMFSGCNKVESGALEIYSMMLTNTKLVNHIDTFKDCGLDTESGHSDLEDIMVSYGGLLDIAPNTLRCKFAAGTEPASYYSATMTCVDAEQNIWDMTRDSVSLTSFMYGITNLIEVIGGNLPDVTSLSHTFCDCVNLQKVGKLRTGKQLYTTQRMFAGCSNLTSVSWFDTSTVTNMEGMFLLCYVLPSIPNLDMSKATTTGGMFWHCYELNENLPEFNLENATDVSYMFNHCTSLESVSLKNCGQVVNAEGLFCTCYEIRDISAENLHPVNALKMFSDCSSLVELPDIDFTDCTNATETFRGCTALTEASLVLTSVQNMQSMFKDCTSLTSVAITGTSSTTNMRTAFANCTSLAEVPELTTDAVTDVTSIFSGCRSVESGALALYQQLSTQANPPTAYYGAFSNCGIDTETGAADLEQIPVLWGGNGGEYTELVNLRDVDDTIRLNRNIGTVTILVDGNPILTNSTTSNYIFAVPANGTVRIIGAKYNDPYGGNNTGDTFTNAPGIIQQNGDATDSSFRLTKLDPNVLYKPNYAPNLFFSSPISEIASLDMINYENIVGIFGSSYGPSNLTSLPRVGTLNKVKYANYAFQYTTKIQGKPFDSFTVFSVLESARAMFAKSSIEELPDTFDGLQTLKYATEMFSMTNIRSIPSFVGLENVEQVYSMFANCKNLTTVNASFKDLGKNKTNIQAYSFLSTCPKLTHFTIDDDFMEFLNRTTGNIQDFWSSCVNLDNAYDIYQALTVKYGVNGNSNTRDSLSRCIGDSRYSQIPAGYALQPTAYYVQATYKFNGVDDTFNPYYCYSNSATKGLWEHVGTNTWTYTDYTTSANNSTYGYKPYLPYDYSFDLTDYPNLSYKIENITGNLYVPAGYWNLRSLCEEISDSACDYIYTYYSHFNNGPNAMSFSGNTKLKKIPNIRYRPEIIHGYRSGSEYHIGCDYMFQNCENVETGITEMYNYLKDAGFKTHSRCFYNCGTNTVSGAAELEDVSYDWK